MAELRDHGTDRPDEPSRQQPQRDAARPQRDRPGQPSDAQMRRFEQGARDYLSRHQTTDRAGPDQPTQPARGSDRPGSPRPSEQARFEDRARQYLDRHRGTGRASETPGLNRDRPGEPRPSDINKVDRVIADRQARHPQHAADRQGIWDRMREASETFGVPPPERRRPATTDRTPGDLAVRSPDRRVRDVADDAKHEAWTEHVTLSEQDPERQKLTEVSVDRPRGRAFRDKLGEKSEDIVEQVKDVTDKVDALIKPPSPEGYRSAVCIPDNPAHISQHYAAHSPGDMFAAVTAAGFVAADLGRRAREKISDWKERHGGHG